LNLSIANDSRAERPGNILHRLREAASLENGYLDTVGIPEEITEKSRLKLFRDLRARLVIECWEVSPDWDQRNTEDIRLKLHADYWFAGANNFWSEHISYSLAGRHIQAPMRPGLY